MMGKEDARNMKSFVTKQNVGYLMHLVGYLYEDYIILHIGTAFRLNFLPQSPGPK
jgi:hypothetical protein